MIEGSCHCGAVHFTFRGAPGSATICNCSVCRRYGVLWVYDYEGQGIELTAAPEAQGSYSWGPKHVAFRFCRTCGCVTDWRGTATDAEGRRRMAVNLRLADPEQVAAIPLQRFDGRDRFDDLPPDGRCVADVWF